MDNRERFIELLETYNITQVRSAELIAAATSRSCSDRTVRSWLNDPNKPSSRPCPDYAVKALEKAIWAMAELLRRRDAARNQESHQVRADASPHTI